MRLEAATDADGTRALTDLATLTRIIDGLRNGQTAAVSADRLLGPGWQTRIETGMTDVPSRLDTGNGLAEAELTKLVESGTWQVVSPRTTWCGPCRTSR